MKFDINFFVPQTLKTPQQLGKVPGLKILLVCLIQFVLYFDIMYFSVTNSIFIFWSTLHICVYCYVIFKRDFFMFHWLHITARALVNATKHKTKKKEFLILNTHFLSELKHNKDESAFNVNLDPKSRSRDSVSNFCVTRCCTPNIFFRVKFFFSSFQICVFFSS